MTTTHHESDVDLFAPDDVERYQNEWRTVQAGFVDDPEAAVRDADKLVERVMDTVSSRLAERRGELTTGADNREGQRTEQLRLALRRYRVLFLQLTGASNARTDENRSSTPAGDARTSEPRLATGRANGSQAESRIAGDRAKGESRVASTDHAKASPVNDADRGERPSADGRDEFVEHRADLPDED